MTVSGSMPFSLASASIVCCRGFDMFLKFHFQVRARNGSERYPVPFPVVGVDQYVPIVHAAQRPSEERLAVHRLPYNQLHPASGEALVVLRAAQRTIEPG